MAGENLDKQSTEDIAKQGFTQLIERIDKLYQIEQENARLDKQIAEIQRRQEERTKLNQRMTERGLNPDGTPKTAPPTQQQQINQQIADIQRRNNEREQLRAEMARRGLNPDGTPIVRMSPQQQMNQQIQDLQQRHQEKMRFQQELAARGLNPDGSPRVVLSQQQQNDQRIAEMQRRNQEKQQFEQELARRGLNSDGTNRLSPQQLMNQQIADLTRRYSQNERYRDELRARGINADGSKMTMAQSVMSNPLTTASLATLNGVMTALKASTPLFESFNNSMLTASQRTQQIAEGLPIIGSMISTFRHFGEAVTGVTDKLRMNQIELERATAEQARGHSVRMQLAPGSLQAYSARARSMYIGAAMPGMMARGDRSTVAGMQQFEFASAVQGPMDSAEFAKREAQASRATAREASRQAQSIEERHNELLGKRAQIQSQIDRISKDTTDRSKQKVQLDEAFARQDLNNQAIAQSSLELTNAKNRAMQTGVEFAQKQHAAGQAQLAVQQAELGVLKQREQLATSNAQRLGFMNVVDRQIGIAALDMAKNQDWDTLPDDLKAAAARVAPQEAAKYAEKAGERAVAGDSRYGQFAEFRDTGDLRKIRGAVDNATANVRATLIFNEQELAKQVADVIGPLFKNIKLELERSIEDERLRIENNQRRRFNTSGG